MRWKKPRWMTALLSCAESWPTWVSLSSILGGNEGVLKCSTSLWSADLGNLAADMKRVEPYSERFHLDVADGHYVKTLLFFPDLVKALRPHTRIPFEIHLMTTQPLDWIEPFVEAGADGFIFCFDAAREPGK